MYPPDKGRKIERKSGIGIPAWKNTSSRPSPRGGEGVAVAEGAAAKALTRRAAEAGGKTTDDEWPAPSFAHPKITENAS